MRTMLFATALLAGCHATPSPAPATPSVEIGKVGTSELDVEPPPARRTEPMREPKSPEVGFIVDDHVGAHAVPRERALRMASSYDEIAVLRVVGATRDEVTFDATVKGNAAGRVRYGAALGQIAVDRFPVGKMFVGAVAFDPSRVRDGAANAIVEVEVESEHDAQTVMAEIAALRRGR